MLFFPLMAPLRRGHGGGGGRAPSGSGIAAAPTTDFLWAAVIADSDEAVVDGRRFAEESVVKEHCVGNAVHLDVADAARQVGGGISSDPASLDGELGAVTESRQNRVLRCESVESAEENGCR